MAQVCAHRDQIAELGGNLLFVGSGSPAMAAAFQAERCPNDQVAVDPKREAFKAFELKRGVASVFSPRSVLKAVGAFRGGHRQGSMAGDPWQLGGAFVVDTAGEVRFAYPSKHAGDHPEVEHVLTALRALGGAPA